MTSSSGGKAGAGWVERRFAGAGGASERVNEPGLASDVGCGESWFAVSESGRSSQREATVDWVVSAADGVSEVLSAAANGAGSGAGCLSATGSASARAFAIDGCSAVSACATRRASDEPAGACLFSARTYQQFFLAARSTR